MAQFCMWVNICKILTKLHAMILLKAQRQTHVASSILVASMTPLYMWDSFSQTIKSIACFQLLS